MRNESDRRFEQVEKRFEKIDKQFELQSKAIMDIHQEIKLQMRWSFGVLIAIGGLVVGVLRVGKAVLNPESCSISLVRVLVCA